MPTQHVELAADAATNLTDDLSLVDGMNYTVQALGGTVRVVEIADATDIDLSDNDERATAEGNAFYVQALGEFTIRQVAGNEIFAWGDNCPCRLVVSSGYS